MARPSSSGMEYMIRPGNAGSFIYRRTLRSDIVPHFHGQLDLEWSAARRKLASPGIVKVSLKTGDEKTARIRWGHIHVQVEALLEAALGRIKEKAKEAEARKHLKKAESLSGAEIVAIAGQVRHDVLADDDRAWEGPEERSPMARIISKILAENNSRRGEVNERAQVAAQVIEQRMVKAALKSRDLGLLDQELTVQQVNSGKGPGGNVTVIQSELSQRLQENGLDLAHDSPSRRRLGLAVLRAKDVAMQDVAARRDGVGKETPERPAPIQAPAKKSDLEHRTLSQMHEEWVKLVTPDQKTIDDNKLYIDRFIAMHGDLDLRDITRPQVKQYRDQLLQFPRNMPHALQTASPVEIIAWADAHPKAKRLGRRTVNAKGIDSLSKLFNKAVGEGYADANPCSQLKLKIKPEDRIKRLPLNGEELRRLLSGPVHTDPNFRQIGGCGAAAYWLPLLGMFTGARLEELGQLHVADVKNSGALFYLDITNIVDPAEADVFGPDAAAAKSLKTASAKRQVPIHHQLIELGFLDYLASRIEKKGQMLFPQLKVYRERYTKNWSKWFGRYLNDHVTKSPEKCFHSFRHGFKDALKEVDVDQETVKGLLGHADSDVTESYGVGISLKKRNVELQKLKYEGLDLSGVVRPYVRRSL